MTSVYDFSARAIDIDTGDEIFSHQPDLNFDNPRIMVEVLNVMRLLGRETDMTMLLVTHEMSFAHDFADRVLFFDKGRIVESGPPDAIFTNPKEERTQAFLRKVVAAGQRV